MRNEPALYVVATPIGNLKDISLRALDVLKAVDFVASEDTRHSRRLLSHYGISTKLIALHDHNEKVKSESLLDQIEQAGVSIALVSDAGTPLISDPGYFLVNQARMRGIKVVPVPGASALITALSVAGLPSDRFVFEGFMPAKNKARIDKLTAIKKETATTIFYESPHRIVATLEAIVDVLGDRHMVVARELTKNFETVLSFSASEMLRFIVEDKNQQKGEFVLLIEGEKTKTMEECSANMDVDKMLSLLVAELPLKKAAAIVAEMTGLPKKQLYERGLMLKNGT